MAEPTSELTLYLCDEPSYRRMVFGEALRPFVIPPTACFKEPFLGGVNRLDLVALVYCHAACRQEYERKETGGLLTKLVGC